MESITKCLATNIRTLRRMKNLTQTELAQKAGISLIFVQGIESERKWVSPATAKAIADALEVPQSKLFENCFEKKIASSNSNKKMQKKIKRTHSSEFDHLPDDIFLALSTTCKHPKWKWEFFRWILEGYERDHFRGARST